jgi:putative flavoprotein involved in K+ transport
MSERIETAVIGGGQAGLAVGYHLARSGQSFVILDANEHIGDAWRTRWDSLRLFTPARYDGLPGWRFPASGWSFPTKDEMADYLEAYAARFDLPVKTGVRVDRLTREGGQFIVDAGEQQFESTNVVIASGAHSSPRIPRFASRLAPDILQLHSSAYRNPRQLRKGGVLVVGAANSGAEIAYELAADRPTWLAGRDVGQIPVRHGSAGGRVFFRIIRFVGHHILTVRTPIGRKVGRARAFEATPLIRRRSIELRAAGVERVPRVAGVRDGLPVLDDERVLEVANVIWSTGFGQDFSWIELPVFAENGELQHDRGRVRSQPGLYFVGLLFQSSVTSDVLPGVGRDARAVAKHITRLAANEVAEVAGEETTPTPTEAKVPAGV